MRCVAGGTRYLDPALTRTDGASASASIPPAANQPDEMPALNDIEERVLRLVAECHSNDEIAQQLTITTDDVRTITSAAMQKAGLTTRVQVVAYLRGRGRKRTQ